MRITGLGHAGMFIETAGGSILCDPVIGPTFFGSWFPFPDNRGLDWEKYGKADFLYISHRHRDHFDPALMQRYVPKDIKVLLPDYPTDDLEQDLRRLGYDNIVYTQAGVPLEFGDLKLMVTPLRAPSDGPIGDSSLSVDDGTASILNQNDSHPLDLEKLLSFSQARGVLHAGVRRDLVADGLRPAAGRRSRTSRSSSATRRTSARCTTSRRSTPSTSSRWPGRRCSCARSCSATTGYGLENDSIFTDQRQFLAHMKRAAPRAEGLRVRPRHGGRAERRRALGHADALHGCRDRADLRRQVVVSRRAARHAARTRSRAEEASRAAVLPPDEMLAAIKEWWEPLLRRGRIIRDGVGGIVRFRIGDLDMVVDFPKAKVREYAGEECIYWYTIPADLVSTNIARPRDRLVELDLPVDAVRGRAAAASSTSSSTTFLKCLSRDRIEYVENWYAEQTDETEDVQLGDWVVQRRCPHLRADLSKTGKIEDGVLTCRLHDWKWDLASGKCLTSQGHPIRASQVEDDAAARGDDARRLNDRSAVWLWILYNQTALLRAKVCAPAPISCRSRITARPWSPDHRARDRGRSEPEGVTP